MESVQQQEVPIQLRLDNVLSTEPELGPTLPDGGYGWVVAIASAFFHILVPSISIGFGIFILFNRIETGAPIEPQLWDNNLVYVSLFFIITSTLSASICRLWLCENCSRWPRLVATAGTCLTCAGILLIWTTVNTNRIAVFILAGILSGCGATIILTQTDIILGQYFKLKIELIRTIMNVSEVLGYIFVPIGLGSSIIKYGILHVIIWYQAVILQGFVLSIAFKKPMYLKSSKTKYRLIRGLSDEEEDVFAKNTTELQQPRTSTSINAESTSKQNTEQWETFEDQSSNTEVRTTNVQRELHNSFANEFAKDLDNTNKFEDNYVETPKPLFSEPQINNNTSYSYESSIEVNNEPIVFMPIETQKEHSCFQKALYVFKQPTFYKSLVFFLTAKFSVFVFWTLFPSYLYSKIDYLRVNNISMIVGMVSIASLIFVPLLNWIKSNRKMRPIFFWIFCWMGAIGYIIVIDTSNKTLVVFGAFIIILSLNALQILGYPLMMGNIYCEKTPQFVLLNTITGLALTTFLALDVSYRTCFQILSVLNFVTGSIWLTNFLYKKLKNEN
ncbi:hypothetical protein FQR65_LT00384 [Abscondita terminalis]|nr:hypothetical protein FQR65_LT00384 [Abscondita terminalis]